MKYDVDYDKCYLESMKPLAKSWWRIVFGRDWVAMKMAVG